MTPARIELDQVGFAVAGKVILSGLTLRASERRIGIVGRNGSGKTTLARLLAGLIVPTGGKARIEGVDIAEDRRTALRTVGILFQNPDHQIIFPTVEEEIAFGLRQLGHSKDQARAEVHNILAGFGKAHWAAAPIQQLSQGQRQLVCLMAVLAMRPAVIILDEPFGGLDIPTRMQLCRHLDALEQTLVQISHDPSTLENYQQVIWLDEGRILADGPPAEVLPAFCRAMQKIGGGDDLSYLAG